ncbi:MAG: MFS transporter [candidate division Zixibacteria bacterium]|nr:MFS transporter [candidate division Zixibacteria bacterium]
MLKISKITTFIKSYDYRLWVLFFGWLVSAMGFAMVIPYLSIYFHNQMKISMSLVGTLFGVAAISRALLGLIGGDLSDRVGRVKMMGMAQLFRGFIFLFMSVLAYKGGSFYLWSLLVILNWMFGGFYQPVANAMAADIVSKEKRVEAYSILRIGGNTGWAIGPMIGGFLASASYPLLFIIGGILTFLSSALIFIFLTESIKPDPSKEKFTFKDLGKLKDDHNFLLYCTVSLLLFVVIGQLVSTISVFSVDYVGITEAQLGFLYTLNGAIVIFFQLPASKFTQSKILTRVLLFGSLGYSIGYFLFGFSESFAWLFFCMLIISVAEITVLPASMAIAANLSREKHHGLYMGGYGLSYALGWSFGPLIGGVLIDLFSTTPFILWGIIALLGLGAAFGFRWLEKKLPADVISISEKRSGEIINQ